MTLTDLSIIGFHILAINETYPKIADWLGLIAGSAYIGTASPESYRFHVQSSPSEL